MGDSTAAGNTENPKKAGLFGSLMVGIVVMAFGLAIGLPWISSVHHGHRLESAGVQVVGTVTDVDFSKSRRSTSKVLTYSYTTDDGTTGTAVYKPNYRRWNEGSREEVRKKLLGSTRNVYYDPDNVGDAIVEGNTRSYAVPAIFLAFFTVVGGFLVWVVVDDERKRRRKRAQAQES